MFSSRIWIVCDWGFCLVFWGGVFLVFLYKVLKLIECVKISLKKISQHFVFDEK